MKLNFCSPTILSEELIQFTTNKTQLEIRKFDSFQQQIEIHLIV